MKSSSRAAGAVVATKSVSSAAKRSGSSLKGKWPAPGKTSSRLCGISSCAWRPCSTGMIASLSPHTSSVGTPSER